MKSFLKLSSFLMVVCILLFLGCEEDTSGLDEPETDTEAIQWLILENPSYFNTQTHYGEEDTTSVGGPRSPIITYFWYRDIDPLPSINVSIDIIGDSAFVVWTGDFDGIFNLWASESFPPDTIIHYTKEYTDFAELHAVFKRLYTPDEDPLHRRGWRLTDISGAESISEINTVCIDSVRLNSVSYPNKLFTDPLALFDIDDIVTLTPGEECTLTVYTNSDPVNIDHVFLHSWRDDIEHHRHPFDHIENGIFSGVWIAPTNAPNVTEVIHHSAFDMISYETLEDDTLSYNSNAWLFPYRVVSSR